MGHVSQRLQRGLHGLMRPKLQIGYTKLFKYKSSFMFLNPHEKVWLYTCYMSEN